MEIQLRVALECHTPSLTSTPWPILGTLCRIGAVGNVDGTMERTAFRPASLDELRRDTSVRMLSGPARKVCTISQPQPIRESSLLNVRGLVTLRELKLNSITDIEIGFGFKCHADLTDVQAHRANRSFTRRTMGLDL